MFIDCLVYVAKERELAFLKQSSRHWGASGSSNNNNTLFTFPLQGLSNLLNN